MNSRTAHRLARLSTVTVASCLLVIVSLASCGPGRRLAEIRALHAVGKVQESIEPLRELLAEDPENGEVLYLYGVALNRVGTSTEALWALRAAMDDPAWRKRAGLVLASGALASHNYTVALEACERILAADPDDLDALLLRARTHAASKLDYEQALADAERVLEIDPQNIAARDPQIVALLGLQRIDEAAAAMAAMGEQIGEAELPPSASAWHCATMAIFAADGGKLDLAEQRWSECLDRFPSDPEVVTKAIAFYDQHGKWGLALKALRAALEDEPRQMGYRIAVAQRLRASGKRDEAEALLREATEFEERSQATDAWLALVTHYQELGDFEAAAAAAARALELAKQGGEPLPGMLFDYADALVLAGDFDRALAVAEELTVEAHKQVVLARVAMRRGELDTALDHFSQSFLLWPDNAITRYYAAVVAEQLGDFERAIEEYRYSIRIDPEATDARVRLARLHDAEGKPEQALQVLLVRVGKAPLDQDGELLSVSLFAQAGKLARLRTTLQGMGRAGSMHARAVASAARGFRRSSGPQRAIQFLKAAEGIELDHPRDVAALRAFIECAYAADRGDEADTIVSRALAAHPRSAALQAASALAASLRGLPADAVRQSYAKALELDGAQLDALIGLAELALSAQPELALSYFDRALAVDALDLEAMRGRARALVALAREEEADAQLEATLREHPFDPVTAMTLVRRHLLRNESGEAVLGLARRAVRFGGGIPALGLLSRIHSLRDEPELAAKASAQAQALRERAARPSS